MKVDLPSSHLQHVEYDIATGQLQVTFQNGRTYHYDHVAEEHAIGLIASPSAGKFFNRQIRPHYTGVEQVQEES